jgi:hypothetical protein
MAPERPRRFSVALAAGSNWHDGGDAEAVSFGYAFSRAWTVVLNVERSDIPRWVQRYPDGYVDVGPTQTLTSISAELRQRFGPMKRLTPFWFVGGGPARLRSNDIFYNRTTDVVVRLLYGGGGVLFSVRPALAVGVDAKIAVWDLRFPWETASDREGARLPIRAVVTWRF